MALDDIGGIPFDSRPIRIGEGQFGAAAIGLGRLPFVSISYGRTANEFERNMPTIRTNATLSVG
jgi:hypothetical protein